MNEEIFYVIFADSYGAVVQRYTRDELLAAMAQDLNGCADIHESRVLTELPVGNTREWAGKALIIRGNIVEPVPTKIVQSYALVLK